MKAMRFVSPGAPLVLTEVSLPSPRGHELLIRVQACGVCRTDLHLLDGELPAIPFPVTPGHEIVGTVAALGPEASEFRIGDRVGVPWLAFTCGECLYCRSSRENLCERARFTGYTRDGGYAERVLADERYCLPLPAEGAAAELAPLLCAGLIGYRAYRLACLGETVGEPRRLGLYGFGAAAHLLAQVARAQGVQVFAFTRPGDTAGQRFARELGAEWAGGSDERPGEWLDAAIVFAPVGALVPAALGCVRPGGRVVCAGIHMSDVPAFPYRLLWGERSVSSVANLTGAGWVHRRRDHGGVIFVDLRDREGLLQIIFDPEAASVFTEAERLRNEFVVRVTGRVRERPPGTVNANLASGRVELVARELELLNRSEPLPFQLDEQVGEEVRLRYRYLDLRREVMSERLRLRHRITRSMRGYLDTHGFIDLETPMLTKATPEGARDYLVPSRTHPGKFFALPQSPQIFKQLLMISGFDRYYQIVRCFRDEDLRADRQPEFTQLDIETSFLPEDEIMRLMEGLMRHIFREVLGTALPDPFPRMSYAEALRRYASDKPDLRIALELVDVADLVRDCEFKVFASPAKDPGGRVAALRVPGGGALPRSAVDDYTAFVARYGARGLAYIKVNEAGRGREGLQSPIIKFLSDAALTGILERTGAADNDLIFFGADSAKVVNDSLGALRRSEERRV